jgi:hypothetical protein
LATECKWLAVVNTPLYNAVIFITAVKSFVGPARRLKTKREFQNFVADFLFFFRQIFLADFFVTLSSFLNFRTQRSNLFRMRLHLATTSSAVQSGCRLASCRLHCRRFCRRQSFRSSLDVRLSQFFTFLLTSLEIFSSSLTPKLE